MKKLITALLCAAMLFAMTSCADPVRPAGTADAQTTAEGITTADPDTADSGTTDVPAPAPTDDFDMYLTSFVEKTQTKSYVISPLSFRYALGMLAAGARGETLEQMVKGLGDLNEFEELIKQFNSFEEGFNAKLKADKEQYDNARDKTYLTEPKGALRTADSVWKRSDLDEFLKEYKLRLEMYGAEYFDFTPENVIGRVNVWANEKTEGMIPTILPDDYDVTDLAVVLMNALYYKNSWGIGFSKEGARPFTTYDGKTVDRDFIISDVSTLRYYKDDQTELISVPMQNGVDFIIVLGDVTDLRSKIGKAEYKKATVELPEFTTETALDNMELIKFLKSLGITDVFDGSKADLTGMIADNDDLYVRDIIQKAKIKLDETGVEAAAVTAIMINKESCDPTEPVRFRADREFRFYICTGKTDWAKTDGIMMFAGRVSE